MKYSQEDKISIIVPVHNGEKFIKKTNFNLKGFVDFITDNIYYSNIDDYYYVFQKIIGLLGANKRIMGNYEKAKTVY